MHMEKVLRIKLETRKKTQEKFTQQPHLKIKNTARAMVCVLKAEYPL